MLNIGMTELLCFAIIALLVLGPEKLPEGARFAAKWYGKIKKFIANVQGEIDRELKLSEFREEMQKEIDKITELEARLQQQLDALKTDKNAQPFQASTSTVAYQSLDYLSNCSIPPFSAQHIQQHWAKWHIQHSLHAAPIELKIAI